MAKKRVSKKVLGKVNKYISLLKEDGLTIDMVYIFGSQVKGNTHSGSDIDLCIVSDKFSNNFDDIHYLNSLKYKTDELIDIEGHGFNNYDFNNPYLSLPHEIKTTGIRII